jgi:hypothetical protein
MIQPLSCSIFSKPTLASVPAFHYIIHPLTEDWLSLLIFLAYGRSGCSLIPYLCVQLKLITETVFKIFCVTENDWSFWDNWESDWGCIRAHNWTNVSFNCAPTLQTATCHLPYSTVCPAILNYLLPTVTVTLLVSAITHYTIYYIDLHQPFFFFYYSYSTSLLTNQLVLSSISAQTHYPEEPCTSQVLCVTLPLYIFASQNPTDILYSKLLQDKNNVFN